MEAAIERILAGSPATYGYRRIHALLLRDGLRANPKTVWRILRRRGLAFLDAQPFQADAFGGPAGDGSGGVFRRFGAEKEKAQNLEFLSDNGPEYACRKLRAVLQGFGMAIRRTPRRSPESNGLAEAFFGSFKRDHVNQGELESLEG